MKILYFHQHFTTPKGAGGTRSYEFAKRLAKRGHAVTVICGSYEHGNSGLQDVDTHWGIRRGCVEGVGVVEVCIPYSNRHSFWQRTGAFLRFAVWGIGLVLTERVDMVIASSTPLTVAIPGICAKFLKRVPFVFEVRDLWPELPRAMGVIKNPFTLWLLAVLEGMAYYLADACIGLSPGIVEGIRRHRLSPKVVKMLPNGCDLGLFAPGFRRYGVIPSIQSNDFLAIYSYTFASNERRTTNQDN